MPAGVSQPFARVGGGWSTLDRLSLGTTSIGAAEAWIAAASEPADLRIDGPGAGEINITSTSTSAQITAVGTSLSLNAATDLTLTTGGSAWLHILANGRVGIGTTNPQRALDVSGHTRVSTVLDGTMPAFSAQEGNGMMFFDMEGTENANLALLNSGTQYTLRVTAGTALGAPANSFVLRADSGTAGNRVVVTPAGNVGIGDSQPSERLDLGGGNIAMGWERVTVDCSNVASCNVNCTAGKRLLGGGCIRLVDPNNRVLGDAYPADITYHCNWSGTVQSSRAHAICADIR